MDNKQLYAELDKCMRVIERQREALYWYAEPHGHGLCIAPCCIDNGRRARTALNFLGHGTTRPREEVEGWGSLGEPIAETLPDGKS